MRVHHQTVEGEKRPLANVSNWFRSISCDSSLTTKCVAYAWSWWMACSSSNLVLAPGRPSFAGFFMRHSSALMYSSFSSLLRVCLRRWVSSWPTLWLRGQCELPTPFVGPGWCNWRKPMTPSATSPRALWLEPLHHVEIGLELKFNVLLGTRKLRQGK